MKTLSRDDILGAKDFTMEKVSVPEWGGDIMVKSLTGTQRDKVEFDYMQANAEGAAKDIRNFRAKLVAMCACDKDGTELFSEDDIKNLGSKNAVPLHRVFAAAQRVSGLSDDAIDELKKNSLDHPPDNLSSISVRNSKSGTLKAG